LEQAQVFPQGSGIYFYRQALKRNKNNRLGGKNPQRATLALREMVLSLSLRVRWRKASVKCPPGDFSRPVGLIVPFEGGLGGKSRLLGEKVFWMGGMTGYLPLFQGFRHLLLPPSIEA
jgi:hypothetical protein